MADQGVLPRECGLWRGSVVSGAGVWSLARECGLWRWSVVPGAEEDAALKLMKTILLSRRVPLCEYGGKEAYTDEGSLGHPFPGTRIILWMELAHS